MRSAVASFLFASLLAAPMMAHASACPENPGALGTSRTLVLDPAEHSFVGGFQYPVSLPLNDREVVLTFDDGPLPPYTTRVLDILAGECVKATFFMVGRMARSFPDMVRRIYDEGHTLANHSENHPFNFHLLSGPEATREIEQGFASIAAAVGERSKVAPFFRFPGLRRQDTAERYLASRGMMSWSVDFMADDWRPIDSREIVRRALVRLETNGRGILLLHDIKPATALGLPDLLHQLKARGYRIVHVVPATGSRPKTPTTAQQWRVRGSAPGAKLASHGAGVWPRAADHAIRPDRTVLSAPSPTVFGASGDDAGVPANVAFVFVPAGSAPSTGDWSVVSISVPSATTLLPAPAAAHFRHPIVGSVAKRRVRRSPAPPAPPDQPATDLAGSILRFLTGSDPNSRAGSRRAAKQQSGGLLPRSTASVFPRE